MVQKMEQGCRQSSHDLLPMVKGKKNCNEPFPSNPVISSNHRFKQTIAALLSEDPIGLQLMEMAKGREMALMQPIPQLHLGAITLKCVRRSSTKQLNTRMSSDVLDGPCSTNQYYLKCDPLLIPFSINTKHNETSE